MLAARLGRRCSSRVCEWKHGYNSDAHVPLLLLLLLLLLLADHQ
jgi:hypothetical protein